MPTRPAGARPDYHEHVERAAMETVSIRNLRGENLRENVRRGRPLAITNRGALIGVLIPVGTAWLEHIIDYNLSHIQQSITEGEQAAASGEPAVSLQDFIARLQAQLNPQAPAAERDGMPARPTVRTVRIGDLTARLIGEAGTAGQTLAITNDRQLTGIIIPVTRDLVEFLLEENMSRVLYSIAEAEKQSRAAADAVALPGQDARSTSTPRAAKA
jgi:antitoxin (DNA-binding transcriptional repressor) of toxin-antitoxin stability system